MVQYVTETPHCIVQYTRVCDIHEGTGYTYLKLFTYILISVQRHFNEHYIYVMEFYSITLFCFIFLLFYAVEFTSTGEFNIDLLP